MLKNKIIVCLISFMPLLSSCSASEYQFSLHEVSKNKAYEIYKYDKEIKPQEPGHLFFDIDYLMSGKGDNDSRIYSYRRNIKHQNDKLYFVYLNEDWIDSTLKQDDIEEIKYKVFGGEDIDLTNKNLVDGKYVKLHKYLSNNILTDDIKVFNATSSDLDDVKIKDNGYILCKAIRETTCTIENNLSNKTSLNKTFTYLSPVNNFSIDAMHENLLLKDEVVISLSSVDFSNTDQFQEDLICENILVTNINSKQVMRLLRYVNGPKRIDLLDKEHDFQATPYVEDYYSTYKDLFLDSFVGLCDDDNNFGYFDYNNIVSNMK